MIKSRLAIHILLGLIAIACSVGKADTPSVVSKDPTIIKVFGQPYIWQFPDGREASFKVTSSDLKNLHAPFKVTDNNCSNRQGMSCEYIFTLRRVWVSLVWTKNPDAGKVGRVVQRVYAGSSSGSEICETSVIFTGLNPKLHQKSNAELPPQILRCSDYSWLPDSGAMALKVNRWESEQSENNPETGLLENRSVGGAYGLNLSRLNVKDFEVSSVQGSTGQLKSFDFLFIGDTSSLTLQKDDGMICQTEMTSTFINDFASTFDQLEKKKPSPSGVPTYIFGSDDLMGLNQIDRDVKFWYRTNANVEYR